MILPALVLLGGAGGLALFGVRFYRRQKSGALGGAMSKPKAYWLSFAIWFWFLVCPVVAFDDVVAAPLRLALGAFGVFMWIRGAAEMVMLYVTKNWRPPMGIGHDVLCILLVLGLVGWSAEQIRALSASMDLWALALVAALVVSLVVEIHHAYSFFVAVKGKTTGDDGVWFADEEQEHFRKINRNTFVWNAILTAVVGAFVTRYLAEGLLS